MTAGGNRPAAGARLCDCEADSRGQGRIAGRRETVAGAGPGRALGCGLASQRGRDGGLAGWPCARYPTPAVGQVSLANTHWHKSSLQRCLTSWTQRLFSRIHSLPYPTARQSCRQLLPLNGAAHLTLPLHPTAAPSRRTPHAAPLTGPRPPGSVAVRRGAAAQHRLAAGQGGASKLQGSVRGGQGGAGKSVTKGGCCRGAGAIAWCGHKGSVRGYPEWRDLGWTGIGGGAGCIAQGRPCGVR